MNNDWREFYDPQYVLYHHGIKGQKWGVRNYQNPDGTLTAAGKSRYGKGSDKVEKYSKKAVGWENRAINAKTRLGSNFSAGMATWRRGQADKRAAKATGDYRMLHLNKNTSRALGAQAETNANIAAGLKKRADAASGKKSERLMNEAVRRLSTAENAEVLAKKYKAVADSPIGKKGFTFISRTLRETTYTPSGRKSTIKDKFLEGLGDTIINEAFKASTNNVKGKIKEHTNSYEQDAAVDAAVDVAQSVVGRGVTGAVRDGIYMHKNSASKRWKKIIDD